MAIRSPLDLDLCPCPESPPIFCRGPLYTNALAYHFGGEGEGARVAQVYTRSEVPTLDGGFLSGRYPSTPAALQQHDLPTHAHTCSTPRHFVWGQQS